MTHLMYNMMIEDRSSWGCRIIVNAADIYIVSDKRYANSPYYWRDTRVNTDNYSPFLVAKHMRLRQ